MPFTEQPPPIWDATKPAYKPDGTLTPEFIAWLSRVIRWAARMGAAIP